MFDPCSFEGTVVKSVGSGADLGFFKGGGGGWYFRVAESMGQYPKMLQFEDCNC